MRTNSTKHSHRMNAMILRLLFSFISNEKRSTRNDDWNDDDDDNNCNEMGSSSSISNRNSNSVRLVIRRWYTWLKFVLRGAYRYRYSFPQLFFSLCCCCCDSVATVSAKQFLLISLVKPLHVQTTNKVTLCAFVFLNAYRYAISFVVVLYSSLL